MDRLLRLCCPDDALRWRRSFADLADDLRWTRLLLPPWLRERVAWAEGLVNEAVDDVLPPGCRVVFDTTPFPRVLP